jgi:ribosomal protein L30/L7E
MPTKMNMSVEKLAFALKKGGDMSLNSGVVKTCEKTICWCVVAVIVALTLLALTWTVILASNTSVSGMIKIIFPD